MSRVAKHLTFSALAATTSLTAGWFANGTTFLGAWCAVLSVGSLIGGSASLGCAAWLWFEGD